jgi:predicted PurR-regulated permease PerM
MDERGVVTRADLAHGAKIIVLGLGAVAVLLLLAPPLVHYAAIVACGIILGVALWSVAGAIARRARVPYGLALGIVLVVLAAAIVGFVAWTGPRLAAQADELRAAVTEGVERGREWLGRTALGERVLERAGAMGEQLADRSSDVIGSVRRGVASGIGVLADALIVIVLGVFFAAAPGRYVGGLLLLAPRDRRARLREVAGATAHTLRSWLAARLFLMVVIGTAFGTALAILGLPLAVPIGVLTGALAFIPFVGAVLALLPAVAVAFAQSPEMALQVVLVYVGIQFVETNLLDPLVESRAVHLPPAMVVLAQLVAVVYFGAIGVLISTPLLVVVVVLVRMLYLEDVLGEEAKERAAPRKRFFGWPRRAHG